jgi:hypothetical protein
VYKTLDSRNDSYLQRGKKPPSLSIKSISLAYRSNKIRVYCASAIG